MKSTVVSFKGNPFLKYFQGRIFYFGIVLNCTQITFFHHKNSIFILFKNFE
jgi:hypothetical protein